MVLTMEWTSPWMVCLLVVPSGLVNAIKLTGACAADPAYLQADMTRTYWGLGIKAD